MESHEEKEKVSNQKILKEENIIFTHEDQKEGIESIFSFKNGDLLVFKHKFSILYDGENFKQKQELSFLGASSAFNYLSEDEFIVMKSDFFSLYQFTSNRTSNKQITTIYNNVSENHKQLYVLPNNNILIILEPFNIPSKRIYKRISNEYLMIDCNELSDVDEVLNLNENEFLTIKNYLNSDELVFTVYDGKDISIKRFNKIKYFINGKRKIISSTIPFYKVNNNKILQGSIFFINIFGIDTLELETSIKFTAYNMKDIKVLDDNRIIIIEYKYEIKHCRREEKYFLTEAKIDYEINSLVIKERNDITEQIGFYKSLFNIWNYGVNGLATISDQCLLKVYKNV